MDSQEFLKRMIEADKIISERQAKDSDYRKKNNKAWQEVEFKLDAYQGKYRSNGYNWFKAYSMCMQPVSESMLNKMYSQMTDAEYKLLNND